MATNPKFTVRKNNTNNQYYYRLTSRNGEITLSGEGYTSKQACLTGIAAVKANAPYDSRYDRKISTNNQFYFLLKSGNGEIVGVSEMYSSSAARENGVEAVKRDAPGAPIEDLS